MVARHAEDAERGRSRLSSLMPGARYFRPWAPWAKSPPRATRSGARALTTSTAEAMYSRLLNRPWCGSVNRAIRRPANAGGSRGTAMVASTTCSQVDSNRPYA